MNDPKDSSVNRFRVTVSGRVQGVFYRGSMQKEAQGLGISGWVRNRPDGSVEAVIEGPPAALARLVAWCEKGPAYAAVARVTKVPEEPQGLSGFAIRY